MKLPDEKMLLVGRVGHGCFWADKPATLSDIRAAAKEMGCVVVPIGHLQSWQNYLSTAVEQTEAARDWVSDYLIKRENKK